MAQTKEPERYVYLDNAATTKVRPEVLEAMSPYFTEDYGNASTLYTLGRRSKEVLNGCRASIAKLINCKPDEIYFTSGGTESDNWAIQGIAGHASFAKGMFSIITSNIEHHAVLNAFDAVANDYCCKEIKIPVDETGYVDPELIENEISDNTALVSVMMANNEIGRIEPVKKIGKICRTNKVPFHVDAVQAFGHIPIDVKEMNIDMLSASSHKFNGPKGVGFLYIRHGIALDNLMFGGGQERGSRPGTENIPGIVGMCKAAEIAYAEMDDNIKRETALRDHLINRVLNEIPGSYLNGSQEYRLPNNADFSFDKVNGEAVLLMLDMQGVYVASGSACTTGQLAPSHVLKAIGLSDNLAFSAISMTLGYDTTLEDIDYTVDKLKTVIEQLRGMYPNKE